MTHVIAIRPQPSGDLQSWPEMSFVVLPLGSCWRISERPGALWNAEAVEEMKSNAPLETKTRTLSSPAPLPTGATSAGGSILHMPENPFSSSFCTLECARDQPSTKASGSSFKVPLQHTPCKGLLQWLPCHVPP